MIRALNAAFTASVLLLFTAPSAAAQQQTQNPHGDLKEPCASCHSPDAWKPARVSKSFKHAPKVFPLEGAHAQTNCRACHASLEFTGVSTKCAVCHKDVHQGELGSDCATCHSPRNFIDRSVMQQRHQLTRFPLSGAHVMADCISCHPVVQQGHMTFVGRPVECFSCHMPAYNASQNPPHQAAGFPTTCDACHTTIAWTKSTFDHAATSFPLTGAHLATICSACHGDGIYKGKSSSCVACHLTNYNNTTTPKHSSAGFPTDCAACHSTVVWTDAVFDHQKTLFPLTGAHLAVACSTCHSDGVYKGKSTACVSCHLIDYNNTATPKHSSAGFSTQCATCHSTATWAGAVFDHSKTAFPLTGAHVTLACAACHSDGVYAGKPTTCVSCHLTDYNGTNNPVHSTAGFPTACASCHTTATWLGATFNHDASFFPIYSGTHQGRWSSCATCHTNPANYATFTCLTCHTQLNTNGHHNGVSGYRYDSQACYSCHPRGRAG
jgi:hypothetical protein